jgi:hypothetical protein
VAKLSVYFFPNGTIAFMHDNVVRPELGGLWMGDYIDRLVAAGVDPTTVEFHMPNGLRATVHRATGGFSWTLEPNPQEPERPRRRK